MLHTIKSDKNRFLVDTMDLKLLLGCGRATAVTIGMSAGAKVKVNRRVLWNVEIIRDYLKEIAE